MKVISTIPPYAPYAKEVASHPIVEGLRLNTAMPVADCLDDLIKGLNKYVQNEDKDLYIDLKCRQIRITRGNFYNAPKKPIAVKINGEHVILDPRNPKNHGNIKTPPWAVIEIDHKIDLDTTKPVRCYLNDGFQTAYIVKVQGNRLLMLDGPKSVVGGGESINITHPSLKIQGYLTDLDKEYIKAAKSVGVHNYMLSYVEQESDLADVLKIDPDAKITAKIESIKGLDFVHNEYHKFKDNVRLMAARGDLYVEVSRPHKVLRALKDIIEADEEAIVASRIMPSMLNSYQPSCQDMTDVGFLMEIGYKHFMVGDDLCFDYDSLQGALNVLHSIDHDYSPRSDYSKMQYTKQSVGQSVYEKPLEAIIVNENNYDLKGGETIK